MPEQLKPSIEHDTDGTTVTRALDEMRDRLPPSRFGKLRKWLGGLMGAATVAGGVPEATADKFSDAQSRVANAAATRVDTMDFDSKEEQAREAEAAKAKIDYYNSLLAMSRNPQIASEAIAGLVTIDQRIAKHGVLTQIAEKDPREKTHGTLHALLEKPVTFSGTVITKSEGQDDVDGYKHDAASVYSYIPTRVETNAATVPLTLALNLGKEDPRQAHGDVATALIKRVSEGILDEVLMRSDSADATPEAGKVVALNNKTNGAVLEGDAKTPRKKIIVEQFKTLQPVGLKIEKRGDSFWLVGVRYDVPKQQSVTTAMK